MKYALIGCGRVSYKHIIAAKNNNLEIAGLCDVDIKKAIELKEKYNLKNTNIYQSFDEMLTIEKPELVAIAVPNYLHFSYAYLALEHNCNIIVEKPLSMTVRECDILINKSRDKQLYLSVCHQNRFNDAVIFAKDKIVRKDIGDIIQISAYLTWNRDERYYSLSDWRGKWKTDGGILMNQGIHLLDMICWFVESEIDCIYSFVSNLNHSYIEIDDNVFAFVKFKNNVQAQIEVTTNVYAENLEETLTIIGTLGTIKLSGKSMNKIAYFNSQDNCKNVSVNEKCLDEINDIYGDGHIKLYEDLINSIDNNRELMISGADGKKAVDFANKIYQSNLSDY